MLSRFLGAPALTAAFPCSLPAQEKMAAKALAQPRPQAEAEAGGAKAIQIATIKQP